MSNELIVVDKIEKRLRTPRDKKDNVFPLSPTHRKELRVLKSQNISNLRNRLSDIKKIKQDEYFKLHKATIKERTKIYEKQINILNDKFSDLNKIIKEKTIELRQLEKDIDENILYISSDYGSVNELEIKNYRRSYSINETSINKALKELFNKKFGSRFNKIDKKINRLNENYEEAINFGDLELVKEIYYMLKDADKFLDDVSKIEIK